MLANRFLFYYNIVDNTLCGDNMEKIFENFTITILKLNKLVQKIKLFEAQKYDLKAIHIMCAYYLKEHPEGLTSSELVKLTLEDKGAISRALKILQDRNFVKYNQNRHNTPVVLTADGRKFADFITVQSMKAVEAGMAELTEEERAFCYKWLGSIAVNLEQYYTEITGGKDD